MLLRSSHVWKKYYLVSRGRQDGDDLNCLDVVQLFNFIISNISTRIFVVVMLAMVAALIVGSVPTAWQSNHNWDV
jgi:hypothetical protein